MKVCDSKNDDLVAFDDIDQPVGKAPQPIPAHAIAQEMPSIGVLHDKLAGSLHLIEESLGKLRCLLVVPSHRFVEFCSSRRE
ncbi:hypothetical protein MnTg02_01130 [bacterium MnTg02]|nr:hypothetical protein MnTg02_01130 [bacterium MnTg02]